LVIDLIDAEHKIQVAITQYLDLMGVCYWAVPNGGGRALVTGIRLKAEGVKAGVPDITIVHNGRYIGIEVKKPKTETPKGKLSAIQKAMINCIQRAGGEVHVVYGVEDVEKIIKNNEKSNTNTAIQI